MWKEEGLRQGTWRRRSRRLLIYLTSGEVWNDGARFDIAAEAVHSFSEPPMHFRCTTSRTCGASPHGVSRGIQPGCFMQERLPSRFSDFSRGTGASEAGSLSRVREVIIEYYVIKCWETEIRDVVRKGTADGANFDKCHTFVRTEAKASSQGTNGVSTLCRRAQ